MGWRWSHSAGTEDGADGTYMFELSRLLVTASTATDAQMTIGETYEFGGECRCARFWMMMLFYMIC
jgi:hypothetical protein